MALDNSYLQYPHRSYGMDHNRYDWSMLADRPAITWPNGAKLALWVNVSLQYYPLNQRNIPFAVPGGMTMPYPDLRHYSLRDYGNRVGIYRFLKAFEQFDIKPTFAINSHLAQRTPYLLNRLLQHGGEIICHGWNMDHLHYGGMDRDEEAEIIERSLTSLREMTGQAVSGWLSPARNESEHTPELLRANGVDYFCDWVNDDMPFHFHTAEGALTAMPLSNELEDRFVLGNNLHSEQSWLEQISDACDFLIDEAQQSGGRILALNLHPWVLGQPHRIAKLEAALKYICSKNGIWSASATEIRKVWMAQAGTSEAAKNTPEKS